MKIHLKNQTGTSLISVLIIGSVLIISGMFILKETQESNKRKIRIEYKIQEDRIEDTLINTLSNKDICTPIFNSSIVSDGTNASMVDEANLKKKIKDETKKNTVFESLDYEITSIVLNNKLSINNAKRTESTNAILNIKIIRDSKAMALLKRSSDSIRSLSIPINFEFDINKNGDRKLLNCNASTTDQTIIAMTKKNCEFSGGKLDSNMKCIYKINELLWDETKDTFKVDTKEDSDLQDILCKIDNSVTQKLRTSSTDQLYSEFCPTVQFNGCIDPNGKKYKNGEEMVYEYQDKKKEVYRQAHLLNYQSNYLRYLRYSSMLELNGLDFSKTNLYGNYVKQHKLNPEAVFSGIAAGSVFTIIGLPTLGVVLIPVLSVHLEKWICGRKFKGTVHSVCLDGREVLTYVDVEYRGFKRWKCKWLSDGKVIADNDGAILENIAQLSSGNISNLPQPTYSTGDSNEIEKQDFIDVESIKERFKEEINDYSKNTSLENLYSKIKDIKLSEKEKLSSEDYKELPVEMKAYENYINTEIRNLEIKKWDEFRETIINFAYGKFVYSTVADFINQKQYTISSNMNLLVNAKPFETSDKASQNLLNLQENVMSKIEDRINSAKDLKELEDYGDPSALKGALDSKFNYRLNTIINTYNTKQKDFQPKPTT